MYATLLMDVEDLVDPEADDITRQIAEMLSGEGIQATFCVVGERVRQWWARGRQDVVDALARHDIGCHTDQHSVHPTVAEYLASLGWEDGVAEEIRRDGPAVDAITQAFGHRPSCWGGPGNTWGPQVNGAMVTLGVPAQVYAQTRVPGGGVHRYCGVLAYPTGVYVGDDAYHLPERWRWNIERVHAELDTREAAGDDWVEVFVGHPSRILHEEFWDAPSFLHGVNPPLADAVPARRKTDADLDLALTNLRETIRSLRDRTDLDIRTIHEMNDRYARFEPVALTPEEAREAAGDLRSALEDMAKWPVLPDGFDVTPIQLLAAEQLGDLQRLRARTVGR